MTAFKAITLPVNGEASKSVISGGSDLLLLFLCTTENIEPSQENNESFVILYLHTLSKGNTADFSTPYRVLRIEKTIFVNEIVNNNCVLPRRYFSSKCLRDLVDECLLVNIKGKLKFTHAYIRTYTDINSFFYNLYRNMNYKPFKMFLVAYYFFKYGQHVSLYVLSDIFDKYYDTIETTNPKENYHLLRYIIRRYEQYSLKDMNDSIVRFNKLVSVFTQHSLKIYATLNDISKKYSHEDSGGVVCSYALTKSFQNIQPLEFLNGDISCIEETFTNLIDYYNTSKFDDINSEISKCFKSTVMSASSLTRYLLKHQHQPIFSFKVRKGELKNVLANALIQFYGTNPPPYIDMHSTSILCEMLAGSYSGDNKFAATEILNLKPFKPLLSTWKGKDYEVLVLNSLNIDKPVPAQIIRKVKNHLRCPSINSFVEYGIELVKHIDSSGYYFHETINPFLPIYTINADLDIYDKQYIQSYYVNDDQWGIKQTLYESISQLVVTVCNDVLKLPVTLDNTTFYMYESVRDDLDKIDSVKFKLGLRIIMKFTSICFMNRTVVDAFLKVLNLYRWKFDHLRLIQDEDIFDKAVYGLPAHEIRLPLNMKPDGSKPLIPIFFPNHKDIFMDALQMTTAFVHSRNNRDPDAKLVYVYEMALPAQDIVERFDNSQVYRNMFLVKRAKKADNSQRDLIKSFKFTLKQKDKFIDVIDRYSCGRLKTSKNQLILKILKNKPLVYQGKGVFGWCSGLKFCAISNHANATRNPCDYYVRVNPKQNTDKYECYVYCHCYSSVCKERTNRFCIWKCLL
jgi:hypothetical protein